MKGGLSSKQAYRECKEREENDLSTNVRTNGATLRLVETAVLLGIGAVLSLEFLSVSAPWMMGGSVTFGSMLAMVIIAHRYGTRWGVFASLVYALLQMVLGLKNVGYAPNAMTAAAIILFDYLIAYGVLGLSSLFTDRFKNRLTGICVGISFTFFLRFVSHFIVGWLVWQALWPNEQGMSAMVYSFVYNGSYMLPETLIAIGITVLTYPALKKFWEKQA